MRGRRPGPLSGLDGPEPPIGFTPGAFRREQVGHVVLRGPAGDGGGAPAGRDLYPFLCYLPDPDDEKRLHYYEMVYRYGPTHGDALVLEYDRGRRHPRREPVAGLEEAFTAELLARAFRRAPRPPWWCWKAALPVSGN